MNEQQTAQVRALGEDPALVVFGPHKIGAAPTQTGWWFMLISDCRLFLGKTWDTALAKLTELVEFAAA